MDQGDQRQQPPRGPPGGVQRHGQVQRKGIQDHTAVCHCKIFVYIISLFSLTVLV